MTYKDMCFCKVFDKCRDGDGCFRALTDEVKKTAGKDAMFSVFMNYPECFKGEKVILTEDDVQPVAKTKAEQFEPFNMLGIFSKILNDEIAENARIEQEATEKEDDAVTKENAKYAYFIKVMDEIKVLQQEFNKYTAFTGNDEGFVQDYMMKSIELIIDVLAHNVGDDCEWIDYFIFDNQWGRRALAAGYDDEPKPLETYAQLYDLIIHQEA